MKKFVIGALLALLFVPAVHAQRRKCTFLFSNFRRDREIIREVPAGRGGERERDLVGEIFRIQIFMNVMQKLDKISDQQARILSTNEQMLANQNIMMQWMTSQSEIQAKVWQAIQGMTVQPQPGGVIIEPIARTTRTTSVVSRLRSRIALLKRCCAAPKHFKRYYRLYRLPYRTTQNTPEKVVKEFAFYMREIVNNTSTTGYIHIGSIKVTIEKEGGEPPVTIPEPPPAANGAIIAPTGPAGGNSSGQTINLNVSGKLEIEHKGICPCGPNCPCQKKDDVKVTPTEPKTPPAKNGAGIDASGRQRPPVGLQTYTTRRPSVSLYRPKGGTR